MIMQFFSNFLDKKTEDEIETSMLKLPWYFNTIEDDIRDISSKTPTYFVNLLGCEKHGTSSEDIKPFVPLLFKLEELTKRSYINRIVRVKANLYTRRPDFEENHFHKPHLDLYNKETMEGDEGEIFLSNLVFLMRVKIFITYLVFLMRMKFLITYLVFLMRVKYFVSLN